MLYAKPPLRLRGGLMCFIDHVFPGTGICLVHFPNLQGLPEFIL